MHLNALYDLDTHTYEDALIQPVHSKDEFGAFCSMVDRYQARAGEKTVFIGNRGYPSYNTMAHVIHAGHFFVPRQKQEVWARLITYNLTETMIRLSIPSAEKSKKKETKHDYQINFSTAAHI